MSEEIAKAAMFFAGLKLLQTLNLCWTASFTVLMRFGISPTKIGLFIGDTGACLELWAVFGLILGFPLGLLNMLAYYIPGGMACFTTIFLFIVHCRLVFVCLSCSGYDGVRKYFYWLCFSAIVYQTDSLLCPATWGALSAWFYLAMELTNFLIPVVHWIARLFFKIFSGRDILFWKLCFQLGSMVFFTFVCVVCWCVSFGVNLLREGCNAPDNHSNHASGSNHKTDKTGTNDKGAFEGLFTGTYEVGGNSNGRRVSGQMAALNATDLVKSEFAAPKKGINPFSSATQDKAPAEDPEKTTKLLIVLSPFFMGAIGMGSIFWLFPVVFPFMVCHYAHFESTQIVLLVLGSIATLIVWVINDGDNIKIGPGWKETFLHDWSGVSISGGTKTPATRRSAHWNITWLLIIPVVFFTWMFFRCLHYPREYFGRSILHSGWAVFWGCVFYLFTQFIKAFGLTGCAMNALFTAKISLLGNVGFMCSMIHLVATLFTIQAYSVGYSSFKCAVESGCPWPTEGIGGFRSYWWWHRYGIRNGGKRFIGLRRIDIISVIS